MVLQQHIFLKYRYRVLRVVQTVAKTFITCSFCRFAHGHDWKKFESLFEFLCKIYREKSLPTLILLSIPNY